MKVKSNLELDSSKSKNEFSFLYDNVKNGFLDSSDDEESDSIGGFSEQENVEDTVNSSLTKVKSKQITKLLMNRLLDLNNVTFFRENFSVALVPYVDDIANRSIENRNKTPKIEVAENCFLNMEQIIFKTLNAYWKKTDRNQSFVLTGKPSRYFFDSIPRLISSTLNFVNGSRESYGLYSQLSLLFKIGTFQLDNTMQSLFGLRISLSFDTNRNYVGYEVVAPLLNEKMHFWRASDGKVLEHVLKYRIFEYIFNAPQETLISLLGLSFIQRHGYWMTGRFRKPEKFTSLSEELHKALYLSSMERVQFLRLASLIILLLDTEQMLIEMKQATLGVIINPAIHTSRIRKYILDLPESIVDEICKWIGSNVDKWSLVSKIEQNSQMNGETDFFSDLAQHLHKALFQWTLTKVNKLCKMNIIDGFNWNYIWITTSDRYLFTNIAAEHLHSWATRYLCESEEVSVKAEGFDDYYCDLWKNSGYACQIVEQFMNRQIDINSLSKKFTIYHSFGPVLYNKSSDRLFNPNELMLKLKELLTPDVMTSIPHFCHVILLDKSPLEGVDIVKEEIANSFLKMVCEVNEKSYPYKIQHEVFTRKYLPKLVYLSQHRFISIDKIIGYFIPAEEFLIGSHSVLIKNSGFVYLMKQIEKAKTLAAFSIQRCYFKYKERRVLTSKLKHLLKITGRSVNVERVYAAKRIKEWWDNVHKKRKERKWAVLVIENFWINVLTKRGLKACVRTIENWWTKMKKRKVDRLHRKEIAARIIQNNVRIFLFRKEISRRIAEKLKQREQFKKQEPEPIVHHEDQNQETLKTGQKEIAEVVSIDDSINQNELNDIKEINIFDDVKETTPPKTFNYQSQIEEVELEKVKYTEIQEFCPFTSSIAKEISTQSSPRISKSKESKVSAHNKEKGSTEKQASTENQSSKRKETIEKELSIKSRHSSPETLPLVNISPIFPPTNTSDDSLEKNVSKIMIDQRIIEIPLLDLSKLTANLEEESRNELSQESEVSDSSSRKDKVMQNIKKQVNKVSLAKQKKEIRIQIPALKVSTQFYNIPPESVEKSKKQKAPKKKEIPRKAITYAATLDKFFNTDNAIAISDVKSTQTSNLESKEQQDKKNKRNSSSIQANPRNNPKSSPNIFNSSLFLRVYGPIDPSKVMQNSKSIQKDAVKNSADRTSNNIKNKILSSLKKQQPVHKPIAQNLHSELVATNISHWLSQERGASSLFHPVQPQAIIQKPSYFIPTQRETIRPMLSPKVIPQPKISPQKSQSKKRLHKSKHEEIATLWQKQIYEFIEDYRTEEGSF